MNKLITFIISILLTSLLFSDDFLSSEELNAKKDPLRMVFFDPEMIYGKDFLNLILKGKPYIRKFVRIDTNDQSGKYGMLKFSDEKYFLSEKIKKMLVDPKHIGEQVFGIIQPIYTIEAVSGEDIYGIGVSIEENCNSSIYRIGSYRISPALMREIVLLVSE